jgi:hypothetical protein
MHYIGGARRNAPAPWRRRPRRGERFKQPDIYRFPPSRCTSTNIYRFKRMRFRNLLRGNIQVVTRRGRPPSYPACAEGSALTHCGDWPAAKNCTEALNPAYPSYGLNTLPARETETSSDTIPGTPHRINPAMIPRASPFHGIFVSFSSRCLLHHRPRHTRRGSVRCCLQLYSNCFVLVNRPRIAIGSHPRRVSPLTGPSTQASSVSRSSLTLAGRGATAARDSFVPPRRRSERRRYRPR